MTTQNYLIVEDNVVTNIVVWDGDINTWTPPKNSLQFVQETTPVLVWQLNADYTAWELKEVVGDGNIGFTWDGSILKTNQPEPPTPLIQITKV